MDERFETELDRNQLIALVVALRQELKAAHERIESLEKRVEELSKRSPTTRLDEPYSLDAEERRQDKQRNQKRKQKSPRRGRRKTQEKLDSAERTEVVCPEGLSVDECKQHRQRPVWRIENGRAATKDLVLVTNLLDVPAEVIALIYRCRWMIELFFRFLKHVLGCRHLLSQHPQGIEIQSYCAIIACLLISLTTGKKPTLRTYEMLCYYFMGLADEAELLAHLNRLPPHNTICS